MSRITKTGIYFNHVRAMYSDEQAIEEIANTLEQEWKRRGPANTPLELHIFDYARIGFFKWQIIAACDKYALDPIMKDLIAKGVRFGYSTGAWISAQACETGERPSVASDRQEVYLLTFFHKDGRRSVFSWGIKDRELMPREFITDAAVTRQDEEMSQ